MAAILLSIGLPSTSSAARQAGLMVKDDPLPTRIQERLYSSPIRVPDIKPSQVHGLSYYADGEDTVVGAKINTLQDELFSLQGRIAELSESLAQLQAQGQRQSATYYASVATISTQLQSGTTPGNPRLQRKLAVARENLEELSQNVASLNDIAVRISDAASMSSYLLESVRATFGLSGAVEEDHVRLAQLEDAINNTLIAIDRLLNNVNDDITRTVSYLSAERENLRTMSLAIAKGDLFGKSLSNRPFSHAEPTGFALSGDAAVPMPEGLQDTRSLLQPPARVGAAAAPAPVAPSRLSAPVSGPRPLVRIRFDQPDVDFEQPVYMAMNEALNRYPAAQFELVAVHPAGGNAAEVAIESTRARRNAEKVLRSLTQMGMELERINLSYAEADDAQSSEVRIYVQ